MGFAGRGKAASGEEEANMDEEDLLPQKQPVKPKDLTLLGIAELEEYIAGLESEIARARAEIAAKRKQRSGAEELFKR
jgi:uncharacterized small protein (DUF1192 family)